MTGPIFRRQEYSLADLVSGISRRNVHAEAELGPAQGREAW